MALEVVAGGRLDMVFVPEKGTFTFLLMYVADPTAESRTQGRAAIQSIPVTPRSRTARGD